MPFDWKRAMNRDGLIGIVARFFVPAGIRTGLSVILLRRALMLAIGAEAKTQVVILGLDPRIHGWGTHSLHPEQDRSGPD